MPLLTTERQAVAILANRIARDGDGGAVNFARTILGAHAEQARRLAQWGAEVAGGSDPEGYAYRDSEPEVQVAKQVDGKQLNLTLKTDMLPVTSYEELVAFYDIDTDVWKPKRQSFSFWGSGEKPNFSVRADFERDDYQHAFQLDREQTRAFFAELAPAQVPLDLAYRENKDILFEVMIADLHAGRAGESAEQTVARLELAVLELLNYARLHKASRIALVFNGDTFNDDNSRRTTFNGTPQESDGDWRETFTTVRNAIVALALTAAKTAPVDVYIIEGNHDRERSFYLADSLAGLMASQEHVTVHTQTLRNYIDWGAVTIGLAHGDEMKPLDLAMTMLRETDTTGKRFFEWHLGHYHTRTEDELHGVLLRRFRTPAAPDEYHARKGLTHNVRDIVGIVWDKTQGEVATYRTAFTEGE